MKNFKVREVVAILDSLEGAIILDDPSFDNSIVGYTDDGRLVYSLDKMVKELSEEGNLSMEGALEFINCNTYRSLPYMGAQAPIIMNSLEDILDETAFS